MSAEQRGNFSFTPALTDRGRQNRAITVVIRARDDASSAARTSALAAGRTAQVAIAPVKTNMGASVGFEKFATPSLTRGTALRPLPLPQVPVPDAHKSHFHHRDPASDGTETR